MAGVQLAVYVVTVSGVIDWRNKMKDHSVVKKHVYVMWHPDKGRIKTAAYTIFHF